MQAGYAVYKSIFYTFLAIYSYTHMYIYNVTHKEKIDTCRSMFNTSFEIYSYTHMYIYIIIYFHLFWRSISTHICIRTALCIYIYCFWMHIVLFGTHLLKSIHTHPFVHTREVGGWGRDPKKCTGRDWGMGSSTI